MVKIHTLSRTEQDLSRDTKMDMYKISRSNDAALHPFQKAREYQRAVLGAKMSKIFAKPFVGNLSGHSDGINVFAKTDKSATRFVSGSWDGEVIFWDLAQKKPLFRSQAHRRYVKGISFDNTGTRFLTCGDDNFICNFSVKKALNSVSSKKECVPTDKIPSKNTLQCLDCKFDEGVFATGGEVVQVWDQSRSVAVQTFEWGIDTVTKVKFNPVETDLIGCLSMDRGVYIYDIRGKSALSKTIMMNKSSAFAWNPQEPFNFVVGNEDGNCYSYDLRKMDKIKMIHKDHIGAVMDIDFSPTGRSFVTGSFDKTIRIFDYNKGYSKHLYHTKRMQK